jgi:anaerobic ribonucleoside-triphosphate reductase activating protein
MYLHSKLEYSTVNGPGARAVVWLQGCVGMNCPGCWNPETHPPFTGENLRADQLADWILAQPEITGVTFSGGEPMQQAPALLSVLNILHGRHKELSVGLYTGYTEKQLAGGDYAAAFSNRAAVTTTFIRQSLWERIGPRLDFAVMGRYNQLQPANSHLCSSRNQTLRLFSSRYTEADFAGPLEVEFTIDPELIQVTGFPVHGVEL